MQPDQYRAYDPGGCVAFELNYSAINHQSSIGLVQLQVHLPSVLTDGLVNALSIWTLVPFKQFQRNVAEANKEKQLVNRQLKLTANEPVMAKSH